MYNVFGCRTRKFRYFNKIIFWKIVFRRNKSAIKVNFLHHPGCLRALALLHISSLYVLRYIIYNNPRILYLWYMFHYILYSLSLYISYTSYPALPAHHVPQSLGLSLRFANILPLRYSMIYKGDRDKFEARRGSFRQTWTCLSHNSHDWVITVSLASAINHVPDAMNISRIR